MVAGCDGEAPLLRRGRGQQVTQGYPPCRRAFQCVGNLPPQRLCPPTFLSIFALLALPSLLPNSKLCTPRISLYPSSFC